MCNALGTPALIALCVSALFCARLDEPQAMVTNPWYVTCREVQRILMELLNQMDGFDQNVNVKVNKQPHLPGSLGTCAAGRPLRRCPAL